MTVVTDALKKYIPPGTKTSPKGWLSLNCPCCVASGEKRPDDRSRGGLLITPEGGFRYHCFNCTATGAWDPGMTVSKKAEFILRQFGMPPDEIKRVKFKAWQLRGRYEQQGYIQEKPDWQKLDFETHTMPKGAKSFAEWAADPNPPTGFVRAAEYIQERGDMYLTAHEYYWTGDGGLHNRVLIPFFWNRKLVGWNGRLFKGEGRKYYGDIPSNYLFNNHVIFDNNRQYVIVTEGLFDAIGLDCVGALGNELSSVQRQWINAGGKEVIVVPDRNKAGQNLITAAIEERWSVSFPVWEQDIEDVGDAIKRYGRLYTLRSVIEGKQTDRVAINVRRKKFGQG